MSCDIADIFQFGCSSTRAYTPRSDEVRRPGASRPVDRRGVGSFRTEAERRLVQKVDSIGQTESFKNSPDFEANFGIQLVAAPVSRGRMFVDAKVRIKPRSYKNIRLTVYAIQNGKSRKIVETQLGRTIDPRGVSKTFSTEKLIPGKSVYIAAVVDDGTNILGRKVESFVLTDYTTVQTGGGYLPQGRGAYRKSIESLVEVNDTIDVIVGNKPTLLVLQTTGKKRGNIELAAFTTTDSNVEHKASIYNQTAASKLSLPQAGAFAATTTNVLTFSEKPLVSGRGPVDIPGLSMVDNSYSCGLWRSVDTSAVTDLATQDVATLLMTVQNVSSKVTTRAKVHVGKDLQLKPISLTDPGFVGESGTFTLSFTTPYADTALTVYEAGGNKIVPTTATEYSFTTGLDGTGSISMTFSSLPTWFALAIKGDEPLYERTLGWFEARS
jgi:hypothetical protein